MFQFSKQLQGNINKRAETLTNFIEMFFGLFKIFEVLYRLQLNVSVEREKFQLFHEAYDSSSDEIPAFTCILLTE